jgi:hypothetical protein
MSELTEEELQYVRRQMLLVDLVTGPITRFAINACGFEWHDGGWGFERWFLNEHRDGTWYLLDAINRTIYEDGEGLEEFKRFVIGKDWCFEPSSPRYGARKRRRV